jgi:UDP-N-acetylglucosamine 2-epimerase (non-hydrolysing)
MKILSVVGARPNFMKIAPFIRAIKNHNNALCDNQDPGPRTQEPIEHILVHTGQHYDDRMSKAFFENLGLPVADINLGIGSGTHAEQVGNTMIAFEKVLKAEKPDWVVVVGDVNATLACSVTAKKENIKCCHIEAGLRSGDMSMPEEINRLVTDRLSDLLLVPDRLSIKNLKAEGVPDSKIKFVGNIMIDTLETNREKAAKLEISEILKRNLTEDPSPVSRLPDYLNPTSDIRNPKSFPEFCLVTLHRPSNVDRKEVLDPIIRVFLEEVTKDLTLIWPVHPRTKKQLKEFGLYDEIIKHPDVILLEPLGYHEMLRLNMGARVLLTDSGGLQEECTVLGTPCLTLRWNTERPVTLREHGGASVLVGNNIDRIRAEYKIARNLSRNPVKPELWDGHTAERCLKAIIDYK